MIWRAYLFYFLYFSFSHLSFVDTFQEVLPAILPFFHIYGLNGMVLPRLSKGGKIITIPKFVPELFIKVLENNKVNKFVMQVNWTFRFVEKLSKKAQCIQSAKVFAVFRNVLI